MSHHMVRGERVLSRITRKHLRVTKTREYSRTETDGTGVTVHTPEPFNTELKYKPLITPYLINSAMNIN